jgi:hypothetical protein
MEEALWREQISAGLFSGTTTKSRLQLFLLWPQISFTKA